MIVLTLVSLLFVLAPEIFSCSTFCLQNDNSIVYGYNFDWHEINGYVYLNKRNVVKTAFMPWSEAPATWQSKYGSITFNAFGREFPLSGMNEAGLVIATMWLSGTQYPSPDDRSTISESQWIQYQLDNAATVADVIASDKMVRISQHTPAPIHYLVCDGNGNAAAIEFLEGKLVCHTGNDLPVKLLTNSPYSQSLASLNAIKDFNAIDVSGQSRFIRGAFMIDVYEKDHEKPIVDYAFDILNYISQDFTRWTMVFDISTCEVYFKTFRHDRIQKIRMNDLEFDCDAPCIVMNVDGNVGDGFEIYTPERNLALIKYCSTLEPLFQDIPPELWEKMARYPQLLRCGE